MIKTVILMLMDRFGRVVDSIRISVTEICNYNCIFCHREGLINYNSNKELGAEDWGFVAKVAGLMGIKEAKITGGEPLLRADIADIVKEMNMNGLRTSMTTNGYLLLEHAKRLAEVGIEHINVNLPSLNPALYQKITGGVLHKVINGIDTALQYGIALKINFLVISLNAGEIERILDYASSRNIDVNLIELIPLGLNSDEYRNLYYPLSDIESVISKRAVKTWTREFQSRPIYQLDTGIKVTLIKGYGNPDLCSKCTRIRFTPDGRIKTCLFIQEFIDSRKHIIERNLNGLMGDFVKAITIRRPYFTR
ncbi:MAG: GTP 3',8-cyclase MoaA [Desulfurococcaceae archaeon]